VEGLPGSGPEEDWEASLGSAFEGTTQPPGLDAWHEHEESEFEYQEAERLEVAPVTPPPEAVESEELFREASAVVVCAPEEADHEVPAGEQGYVVSLGKRDWRRLHYLGGCSRMPGIHYLRYEFLGQERPEPDRYDEVCKQCWGAKGKAPALEEEPAVLDGELSPETSEAEEL